MNRLIPVSSVGISLNDSSISESGAVLIPLATSNRIGTLHISGVTKLLNVVVVTVVI